MNEKEKKEFYISTCKCCLLAEAMKTCPLCRFKVGAAEQIKPAASTSITGIGRLDPSLVILPTVEEIVLRAETPSL